MTSVDRGQVNTNAAKIYEQFFVPALFHEWTDHVLNAADVKDGQQVLDVGCGTGVLAREAHKRVGTGGSVTGLDVNEGMLTVAKEISPGIDWQHGIAEDLPFPDNHFDAVVCQFALMFFEDRQTAIQEMLRVMRPGNTLVIAVWGRLDDTPGYARMVKLLSHLFGEDIADRLRAPFNLGDPPVLQEVMDAAGIRNYTMSTKEVTARFPSIESWVFTDIKGWTLADAIDDTQYQQLLSESKKDLQSFITDDGSVAFTSPAHIISIVK